MYPAQPNRCANDQTTAAWACYALHDPEKGNCSDKFRATMAVDAQRNDRTVQKIAVKRQFQAQT